jgi:hypothetical protein
MSSSRILLFVILCFFCLACSKGGDEGGDPDNGPDPHVYNPTDLTAPTISINTPSANQVFSSGNTITVSGLVGDDYGLYRGVVKIINDANGVEVKQQAYEIHGLKNYNFSLSHVASVSAPVNYTVVVFFEDHGYNGTTRSVPVRVNP